MILAFRLADLVQVPFGWLLATLYEFTTNYGLALIIFAVIVKLVLLPATAKGKKSTMKMSRLQPQIKAIQAKYPNDQQKQSELMQALYKEEGVSMGGGCLWSLLPLLILFPLYTVVRQPIVYMLGETTEVAQQIVEIIKESGAVKFPTGNFYDQMVAAPWIPQFAEAIRTALPGISEATLEGINFSFIGVDLGATPTWRFFDSSVWAWDWAHIGAALMPILSAGGQLLSIFLSQKMNDSLVTNDKGVQDKETAKESQQAQTSKMMMWIGPAMSLLIGYSMPAAMSLYWFVQGIVTTVSDIYLTRKYRKIYDAEDAERLKKYMAEQAVEAEKERVRAERRAANPEGITQNTSKKKMQQAKQKEEAAAKAAAAKEYAMKRGEAVEEVEKTTLSGIADRPYCKGRAYDPNRYNNQSTEE